LFSDPFLGYAIRSDFNKGEGKFNTDLSITFGNCNKDFENEELTELVGILEILIVARKEILNTYKKKAIESSYNFIQSAKTIENFKAEKLSTEQEIISVSNTIEDTIQECKSCKEKLSKARTLVNEYNRNLQELTVDLSTLESERIQLLQQRAYHESQQITRRSKFNSIDIERAECKNELEQIKAQEKIMKNLSGDVNFATCYLPDGNFNCNCIHQTNP
jgi:chromosome segregation ATPase